MDEWVRKTQKRVEGRQNFTRSWGMIWFLKPPSFPDNTGVLWNFVHTVEFWQSIKPYAVICRSCSRGLMVMSPCVLVIVPWLYQNIGGKYFIFSSGFQGSVCGPIVCIAWGLMGNWASWQLGELVKEAAHLMITEKQKEKGTGVHRCPLRTCLPVTYKQG